MGPADTYLYRYIIEFEGNGILTEYYSNAAPPRIGEEIDVNMLLGYAINRNALLDAGLCEVVMVWNRPSEISEIPDDSRPASNQVDITLVVRTKKDIE